MKVSIDPLEFLMKLDSAQLAAFTYVIREGSFEAAARALHVTPSAISQRIRALEERVGQVLVVRANPCMPTDAGEGLFLHAQQIQLLEDEALQSFIPETTVRARVAIAVNADSLATWFMPAIGQIHQQLGVQVELVVEDQDHSSALLRQGKVLAAVTSDPHAVQGCRIEPLGAMRYVAVATPGYMLRYFTDGVTDEALAHAPVNVFNRRDQLQTRFLKQLSRKRIQPPVHYVPSTHGFIHAALAGIGWGMNPHLLVMPLLDSGDLVEIAPGKTLDVPLHWQAWRLQSGLLQALAQAVRQAARMLSQTV
jgi:LysR family transcriptional regulator, chromosome initiation inhibitor